MSCDYDKALYGKPRLLYFTFTCVQWSKSAAGGAVSIWRTYFVANEWNELQTHRRTSVAFTVTVSVFVLSVVGVGNWATVDPYTSSSSCRDDPNRYEAAMSCVLRFALIAAVYLLTGHLHADAENRAICSLPD